METSGKELLEVLADRVGCDFLSDLTTPFYKRILQALLPSMMAEAYSLKEWENTVAYLTGQRRRFPTQQAARAYLCECLSRYAAVPGSE